MKKTTVSEVSVMREKKPQSKAKKAVKKILLSLLAVFMVIVIAAGVIFGPYAYRMVYRNLNTGYHKVDTTLTTEEKLEDLEYMYKTVCLDNPMKEYYEELYGISYDDIYKKYQGYVTDSQTEFQFFSYLISFLAILPGLHNMMTLPNYERAVLTGDFLSEIYGTQRLKDLNYSWKEDFRDDVRIYDDYNLISFVYVDGTYVVRDASGSLRSNYLTEYNGGQLLSLNGQDPKDMCFEFLDRFAPYYDEGNDCFFREYMFFNDGIGVKYEAELLMPDGTIKTIDLYDDPGFDITFADVYAVYPDIYKRASTEALTEEDVVTDIWDENYVPITYKIAVDAGRKTVYVNCLSCDLSEGKRLASDLQKALDSIDAENVIIDIRSNGGGQYSFATDQLLPVLFSHDVTFMSDVVGGKNDNTKNFYDSLFYKVMAKPLLNMPYRTDKDHFYYTEDFSVQGKATKNYKIYLLTSQNSFSSADVMTAVCKEYDNCTVVGTNTGGEGICGSPFSCYLPNSGFMFVYTPTASQRIPGDGITGISPDIYIHQTVEEHLTRADLKKQDIDADSYEVRQTWDNTLISVLDMIDNG